MTHFQRRIDIAAPDAALYHALTTPAGLRAWWTPDCDVSTHPGGRSTFRFGQTCKVMRIDALTPNSEVRWTCVGHQMQLPGFSRTDEWVGTSIVFRIQPASPSASVLHFEHVGLVPHFECYTICRDGWDHFLASLLRYLETGTGTPFAPP